MYFGPFGAASKIKFVNNLLVTINTAAIGEAVSLALKAGLDPEMMIKAISAGSGGSVLFPIRAPRMVQKNFIPPQGTFEMLSHYFDYIDDMAGSAGAATPLFDLASGLYERGIKRGLGEHDVAAVIEVIDDLSKEKRRLRLTDGHRHQQTQSKGLTMDDFQTADSPAQYFGAFNGVRPLGIDRANYIALQADDPAAAARFAQDNMGFYLVHVDKEGRHYLSAHGLDPYSLVYTRGQQGPSTTSLMSYTTSTI